MADDLHARLAAAKAKNAARAEAEAGPRAERDLADAVALEEAKAEHGDTGIVTVETNGGLIIAKAPNEADLERFKRAIRSSKRPETDPAVLDARGRFISACLVYPEKSRYLELVADQRLIPESLSGLLLKREGLTEG